MMLYWRFAWRELKQRPSRPILTLLSIVIGVGAVVAVTISSSTSRRAFDQIFQTVAGNASLEVSTPVGTAFDEKIVPTIRDLPGVKAVAPLINRYAMLYVGKRSFRLMAMGIDPQHDQAVRGYDIVAGKSLAEDAGILLNSAFAKSKGIDVGSVVELMTPVALVKTKVVGLYSTKGVSTPSDLTTFMLPLRAAQYYFSEGGRIRSAQVVVNDGADEDVVKAAIANLLPAGLKVQPPAKRSALAEETSLSTEQGMRMARGFSLLVAVFIITNTFLINVTQRRKQIGIMRAIGATRAQIAEMVYREAFVMGILGTVLGSLLGIVAAHYLTAAMGTLYQTTLPSIELNWYPFLIGGACGLGISLVAAAIPARKATHLSPLEAMRDVLPEEMEGVQWWLVGLGGTMVVVCLTVMMISILGGISMVHTVWASILLLAGLVLLLPVAIKPLSAITAFFLEPLAPVEGRLARRQLLRHRSRTTLTVGVVFIAAATGIGLANSVMDNVNDVREWYRKAIVADFFVRATPPDMATGTAPELPESLRSELNKLLEAGEIKSLDATKFQKVEAAGENPILIAREHKSLEPPDLDLIKGDISKLRDQLLAGEVALGSVLAERTKLKVGDDLKLESAKGEQSFRVAAIVNDYQAGGLTIHMERLIAKDKLGLSGVDAFVIKADPNRLDEVRQQLQEICDKNGIMLQSFSDIRETVDQMMSGVVASLWAMVVLGLLVSAVGVTNTLTINVLEQTRELGLLRIVAMTQAQVRKTIFTQAVIMGLLALVPGIIAGVSVAYLINVAMMPVLGHPVQFNFHPTLLLGGLIVGLAVVAFAAWFPANRAAKLDLLEALRTL